MRHGEAAIQRNLKEMVEAAEAFYTSTDPTRLVPGGSDANGSQFHDMLPRAIQEKVIGSFPVDLGVPVAEIQTRSMEPIEDVAQKRDVQLVDELITGWKRVSGAAVGLSDTLVAPQEHRPYTLLAAAGFEASGYRCQSSRYVMPN